MSKHKYDSVVNTYSPFPLPQPNNNCICSLPTLIILLLVILQFSSYGRNCCDDDTDGFGDQQIGNGILFIIALYFLSCIGCSRGSF